MTTNKLQEWAHKHVPSDDMLWKGGFGRQVLFLRDYVTHLVGSGLYWEDRGEIVDVISTHRSKSILLPVCEYTRKDLGLRIVLRNNFYDWKLSVVSERPVIADFAGLFHTTPPVAPDYTGDDLRACYFEGFPESLVFGYYEPSNKRRWSACLGDGEYGLMTTLFLIMKSLGAIAPLVWHTQESRRAELEAESRRREERKKREGVPE